MRTWITSNICEVNNEPAQQDMVSAARQYEREFQPSVEPIIIEQQQMKSIGRKSDKHSRHILNRLITLRSFSTKLEM